MSEEYLGTANYAWLRSIEQTIYYGRTIKPRDLETKETLNDVTRFDMNYPICYHPQRKLSYKFMAAEAYWITSGSALVEEIEPYNKHIKAFSDDGMIFNGAYGPMFSNQLEYVVNTLKNDIHSRQAIMTIWHPNPEKTKDYKCTVMLGFNVRDCKLNTTVLMRSNDLWLGRPYDYFNFVIMTLRVLTRLNEELCDHERDCIKLGHLTQHTISAHIYEPQFTLCEKLLEAINIPPTSMVPNRALYDWQYVVDSLLACRDQNEDQRHWKIRP